MPIVVTGSSSTTNEQLILDGLALNDGINFQALELEAPPAPLRQRWIEGDDADGDVLAEPSRRGNRTWTVKLQVCPQASTDAFLAKIGQVVDKLYEAEQQPDGLAATWTPADASKTGTLYVLSGEIIGLPITFEDGWFAKAPTITIRLDARPFLYGTEVTAAATVTNTDPVQILTVTGVTGDVPAEARLVVTDAATQSRRHIEWGRAWRYTPPSALIDSDSLVTSGFSGTGSTRTGAYDPGAAGNSVITATLTGDPIAICGTGNLGHVGTFRVKARVFGFRSGGKGTDMFVRLSWREGDGPIRSNAFVSPVMSNGWSEVDLGIISIPEKTLGTQRWSGQVEAYARYVGVTLDVDYLVLIPTENYGKGRAVPAFDTVRSLGARDEFDQSAGNLNAKTLPVGGTWATSGADATDLAVEATGHTAQRSTTGDASGKYAIAGATTYTDTLVQVDAKWSVVYSGSPTPFVRLIFRWTDVNNYGYILVGANAAGSGDYGSGTLIIGQIVAGVPTELNSQYLPFTLQASTFYSIRAQVTAAGQVYAAIWPASGNFAGWNLVGSNSALATGGTLASGKVGFSDTNTSANANTRNYDNFLAGTPSTDAVVFSGRAAEIRHDQTLRQDSTGTYYGPINSYRGARFFLPPAGDENRPSTIVIKTRRNDTDVSADDQIADSTTVTVHYTPRWSTVPR